MSKTVNVKYFAETVLAKEPQKATEESAAYDLYAAEAETFMPGKNDLVCMYFRWAIPKGFCGRIFPRSSLIKDNNVTVEAGLIDADYRGLIYVLLFNHSEKNFTVQTGERIAQAVFFEKFDVHFEKVSKKEELGATKRGSGGFDSTGITVIKKIKLTEDEQVEDEDLAITAKEGVISVNDEVIYMKRLTTKIRLFFYITDMLVEKIYLIIFFFFLQDVIDLIVWFCLGYFFGHVFFYVFIKARKKNSRKDITDFFEKCKQRMAEKPSLEEEFQSLTIEKEKSSSLEEKENVDP